MLISQLKIQFIESLQDEFPITEIESFFYILTEYYLGIKRIDMALDRDLEISEAQFQKFEKAMLRLKDHEPVQYITGQTEFYGLEFEVNKNVLIPRPETEELIEWIIQDHQNKSEKLNILDIGTGSGCIPICLAKNINNAHVGSFDISKEALALARRNAQKNNVEVDFREFDILSAEKLDEKYDIIVSNPPYVRELEKKEMHKNVLEHEPELALYVQDDDALIFYRQISQLAKEALKENGVLYFEINQYLGEETKALVESFGFEAELKKDIFGNHRMLKAIRK
ncbi:release factor glutamine methyltransferase [Christiangramia gaetbulicola]|uniref:Release factor glutamine methyltransferase n=1 Tax=Christiangramia gaetbulicola TaxID=703340 RepID=A0A2T6AIX7_9FLAO|nr:peptide chain release factor N(5)-glutamine methyltransferase [Christiangramia gaetbulicola]PTX43764.1 release factor glutamine methyltransferase [Christiangramia gaetbulicola]